MNSSKHIIIVNCVFHPEPVVSAKMGYDLALYLSEIGHVVDVICPIPTRPANFDYSSFKPNSIEVVNSKMKIHRLGSYTHPKSSIVGRFRESTSFGWYSGKYIKNNFANADIIYANTWPLMGQFLLSRFCKSIKIPLIFHIQDVYPESVLKKMNSLLSKILSVPLFLIEKSSIKAAVKVILISDRMANHYLKTRDLDKKKTEIVFNWQNSQLFTEFKITEDDYTLFSSINKSKFIFMYMGNIGPVAGVDFLIDSFHNANLKDALLVIAGDGSKKAECIGKVESLGVNNIIFISVPDGKVPAVHSFADVLLLPVRKGDAYYSVPSKLISYLFSGKPILASLDLDSDTSEYIKESGAGWVVEPENKDVLSLKMKEIIATDSEVLKKMGENGVLYGLKQFSMLEGVKKLSNIIINASEHHE